MTTVAGLVATNVGASITGNFLQTGSLSVTSALATGAVVDVYDSVAAYAGNLIQGRVDAGTTGGNLMVLTDGTSELLRVWSNSAHFSLLID